MSFLVLVLSAIHLLPQLRNPFAETTTDRSQPALLKSISQLSRYEAASGSFEVIVDLQRHSFLPSFIEGSGTLFVGQGAQKNTQSMLQGMLRSLGFQQVTVNFS